MVIDVINALGKYAGHRFIDQDLVMFQLIFPLCLRESTSEDFYSSV